MKFFFYSLLTVIACNLAHAQCNCSENFEFVYAKTKINYSGWQDKVNSATKQRFELFTDSLRTVTRQVKTDSTCFKVLSKWLKFFNDRHTAVYQPMINYESKGNRKTPTFALEKVNSRTFLLTLPSFNSRYKKTVDSLMRAKHDELIQTPNLIIDVRNNGGGDDITYSDIIPYLYTNPVKSINNSILSSPDNIQKFEAIAANPSYPEANRRYAHFLVKKLKARPGEFYRKDDNTIRLKHVLPNPVNLVILMNRGCLSSCEEFVLTANQSSKVVLMGENTGGVLDYANVHYLQLPCQAWWLQYATSRTNRLPKFPIDNIGIAPGIKVPEGKDWIEFAVEYLKSK
jgi:hypothetical protein